MVLTYSQPMSQGTAAPDFTLLETVSGEQKSLSELSGEKATVIMFVCNHCPYVQHIEQTIVSLAKFYQKKDVAFIAISANDVNTHPEDAPELMKARAIEHGYSYPYLYDQTQEVAKAYGAECTPEFYVFDSDLKCAYHGRFDDATPGNQAPVTGKDLSNAIDHVLQGEKVDGWQPSMGCNIKWI